MPLDRPAGIRGPSGRLHFRKVADNPEFWSLARQVWYRKKRCGECGLTEDLYSAPVVEFTPRKHLEAYTTIRCLGHVPAGSWVEGRDAPLDPPEFDPEGDRIVAWWRRKLKLG